MRSIAGYIVVGGLTSLLSSCTSPYYAAPAPVYYPLQGSGIYYPAQRAGMVALTSFVGGTRQPETPCATVSTGPDLKMRMTS